MMDIIKVILICILSIAYAQNDPCTTYTILDTDGSDIRSVANSEGSLCDNTLVAGWYRVTSNAGERMPTECIVGGGRCGATYSIWMNGTYPSSGSVKTVQACAAHYDGDCCAYSHDIQVKNCSNYLVYNLVPVSPCYQAYCFGSELECADDQTSENGFTPGCEPDPCHSNNYDILKGEIKRSSNYTLQITDTAIEDSRLKPGWYRIDSITGNDIVNESVQMMQCGTLYPLWMQGNIPDEEDKTVDRRVCRSGLNSYCDEVYNIKVRNCGDYRTYNLPQLNVDKSAYCFGTLPVPITTTTTTTTTTTPSHTTTTTTTRTTTSTTTTPTPRTTAAPKPSMPHPGDSDEPKSSKEDKEGGFIWIVVAILAVLVILLTIGIIWFYKNRTFSKRSVSCSSLKPPTYEETVKTGDLHFYDSVKNMPPRYEVICLEGKSACNQGKY